MSDSASFEFEDEMTRWRREGDERTEAERAARERLRRAERQPQREAAQKASQDWDAYFRNLISEEHERMLQLIEQALGEQRIDIRDELGELIDKSLREPHWVPRVAGVWKEGEEYGRLNIVSKDGSTWLAKRDHPKGPPGGSDDWMLCACRGRAGPPGPQGPRGETGPPGARGETGMNLNGWLVEGYRITPILGGGVPGPSFDLRPLFQRFVDEQAGAASAKAVKATAHRHVHDQPPLVALVHGAPPAPAEEEAPVE